MDEFWTPRRKLIGALLCVGKFLLLVCTLGIAPFYPNEAAGRGCTPFEVGCVFACFPLVGFLLSPFVGNMLHRGSISPKRTLLCGLVIEAIFMCAFSLLGRVKRARAFFWCSLVFRLLQGVGVTLSSVSYFTLAAAHLGQKKASFLPVMEMFAGFGVMLGPTAGGILYELAGFPAPYGTFCILLCLFSLLLLAALPRVDSNDVSASSEQVGKDQVPTISAFTMLASPVIIADLVAVLVAFISIAFNDSTLALVLESFGLNGTARGIAFFVSAGAYSIAALSTQRIAEKLGPIDPRLLSVVGAVMISMSWFLYLPELKWQQQKLTTSLESVMIGQGLLGLGAGVFYVISYNSSFRVMTDRLDYPDDFTSYSILGGCLQSAFFLGSLIGSAGGGVLIHLFTFIACARIIGATTLSFALLYAGIIFLEKYVRRRSDLEVDVNQQSAEKITDVCSHL